MARLLLVTDSNFINNVGDYQGRKLKNLEVKSCQSRRTAMAMINGADDGILIVACLDMVAADIAKSTSNAGDVERVIEMSFNQLFQDLIEKVGESNGQLAVGVVAPLFWTSHSKEAAHAMSHAYKLRKDSTMKNIWCTDFLRGIRAGVDGTHLTSTSANKYIEFIYNFVVQISGDSGIGTMEFEDGVASNPEVRSNWSEEMDAQDGEAVTRHGPPEEEVNAPMRSDTMLSTSILDMDFGQALSGQPPRPGSTQSRLLQMSGTVLDLSIPPPVSMGPRPAGSPIGRIPSRQPPTLASLDERINSLEAKSFYDNLTMAALKEDQDTEANRAMLNRVVMSGVEIQGLDKMDESGKIRAMKAKVTEIIDALKEENQSFEIQFVRHLNKQIKGVKFAVIEIRFPDSKQAKDLRAQFVKKRKEMPDKLNITPVVRLATRVRVEMMHSISAMVKRVDPTVDRAMCLQYAPKPVIKIFRKTAAGADVTKTMSFTESITWVKVNGLEDRLDLAKAYERAGASSRGTLAQSFVLLK